MKGLWVTKWVDCKLTNNRVTYNITWCTMWKVCGGKWCGNLASLLKLTSRTLCNQYQLFRVTIVTSMKWLTTGRSGGTGGMGALTGNFRSWSWVGRSCFLMGTFASDKGITIVLISGKCEVTYPRKVWGEGQCWWIMFLELSGRNLHKNIYALVQR